MLKAYCKQGDHYPSTVIALVPGEETGIQFNGEGKSLDRWEDGTIGVRSDLVALADLDSVECSEHHTECEWVDIDNLVQYDTEEANQFVKDMVKAGFDPYYYKGRFFYHGPAVNCDITEQQEVFRATKIILQSDQMGKSGYVLYPINSAKRINNEKTN